MYIFKDILYMIYAHLKPVGTWITSSCWVNGVVQLESHLKIKTWIQKLYYKPR